MSARGLHPCSKPIIPYAAGTYAIGNRIVAQNATARTLATVRFQHALDKLVPICIGARIDEEDILLDMGVHSSYFSHGWPTAYKGQSVGTNSAGLTISPVILRSFTVHARLFKTALDLIKNFIRHFGAFMRYYDDHRFHCL